MSNIVKHGEDATAHGNYLACLNTFFIKDGETYIRCAGQCNNDIRLTDFIRGCCSHIGLEEISRYEDSDINAEMSEAFGERTGNLDEFMLSVLYNAAWVASVLRANLAEYEAKAEHAHWCDEELNPIRWNKAYKKIRCSKCGGIVSFIDAPRKRRDFDICDCPWCKAEMNEWQHDSAHLLEG